MRECRDCTFCCWSFAVYAVPDAIKGMEDKPALTHCQHECAGCAVHEQEDYPPMCASFICPYLLGKDIHRPDTFQFLLEQLSGTMGNYLPAIPSRLPIEECVALIRKTRSLPATIMINNQWFSVILPLDKNGATWRPNEEHINQWQQVYERHGVQMNESMKRVLTLC